MYLFPISYGSYALDRRNGVGVFSGWPKTSVINRRQFNAEFPKHLTRGLPQRRTKPPTTPTPKEESEQKAQKHDRSFAEDRSLTWSTTTSNSLEPTILSMPTYSLLVFEMMIFRNSIRNGTEFCFQWRKSHLMTSWKDCTTSEYECLRNSRPYWNCMTWRFIRRN